MKFNVVLEKGADGYTVAECPQIPGCMSQGKTEEEALGNIQDAMRACLTVMVEDMIAAKRVPARRPVRPLVGERHLELRPLELVPA